ncbi:MAG TPA: adenylate/guanylate cyclase domain-containing protein [Candidatus Limnocylindria bacterium]|nr:adenylate/guanylate cyclase domain-containing protein [Candidatus Limnocylindria bacterium]
MATKAKCASCGASVRAKDRFCPSCGTPIAAAQAAPRIAAPAAVAEPPPVPQPAAAPSTESTSLQVPTATARALAEQRKVVTILFADLSGSTPLAEKLDPEDLRGILGRYFNTLARQIQRYEGTIDKYIGDAIMCVFGAPISHEDDAERAIRAAIAMQGSIQRLNDDLEREHGVRLALRIGINTGEVVAGLLGGDVQRAYTVVGDAVNTAQRFESVAPLNEVLVSETTRRLAIHSFEFETLPPVTLKGKAHPVAAYRVLRPRDEEIPPEASPLVGRERELARLRGALGDALAGEGQLLAIVGEAGVGKSRLIAEFKAGLAAGVERLSGRCASYETNTPFALVAHLIRGAFRIPETSDEPTARVALREGFARYGDTLDDGSMLLLLDVLGYGERSTLEAERKRTVLVGILRAFLARAGERIAFVIAAEDLHWADLASVAVLAALARDVPTLPCLFITTARTGWAPPWEANTLELPPFTDAETRALIAEILDVPPSENTIRTILERTGGNPFFVEEVVRAMRESGASELPPSVQEVIEARIERLPDGPSRTLQAASVIGATFWYRVLERLLPGQSVFADVSELEHEAFIVTRSVRPELTYGFRQSLLREVAYQTQLLATRRAMHQAVGEAIEVLFRDRVDEFVDLLAYHYDRSEDGASALRWLVRAGDRARALFANDEALESYRAALRRATDGDGPLGAATILERLADVQRLVGDHEGALASLVEARMRAGTPQPETLARLDRKAGTTLVLKGEAEEARAAFDRGLRRIGPDEPETARIRTQLGLLEFRAGAYDDARAALTDAVRIGEQTGTADVLAEALKLLGNVANNVGDLRGAESLYQRARSAYQEAGDTVGVTNVRSNLAALYRRTDRVAEAREEYVAVAAICRRTGDVWGLAIAENNTGEVLRTAGEAAAAARHYEQALAIFERIGEPVYAAAVRMNLGAARVEAGEAGAGRADLIEAEREMLALGGTKFLPSVNRDLAAAELAVGDLDAAEARAERALGLAQRAGARQTEAQIVRIRAEIALARGDRDAARELLAASATTLEELGEQAELRRTKAVIAKIG